VVQAATRENLSRTSVEVDAKRGTVELLQSYNCRVTSVDSDASSPSATSLFAVDAPRNVTVPLQMFHCPKGVPLAMFLIPKCGTTSGVNWAMAMEGATDRASLSKASEQLLNEGSTQRFLDWLTEELQLSFMLSGMPFEGEESSRTLDLSAKLFNRSLYRLSFGLTPNREDGGPIVEQYVTPAHLCPMCCLHGHGRQRVIIGRNPYVRLVSYFRFRWLNLASGQHPRTTWVDFGPWLAVILGFRASRPDFFANGLQWTPRYHESGSCQNVPESLYPICLEARQLALDDHDVFHLRPLADIARDRRHPGGVEAFRPGVHVIHLERIEADITALELKLCASYGYCEKLPAFPLKVLPSGHTMPARTLKERCLLNESTLAWFNCTAPPWLQLWTPQLIDLVARAYKDDFSVLGYSVDPAELLPID